MAVNKVIYDNKTLIDLTEDTVTSDTMIAGTTAHNASGETIVGELIVGELKPATNSTLGGVIVGSGINVDENGKIDVDKNSIGLENVDNTSDIEKPISTKVQEALNSLNSLITTLENKVNTNEDDIEGKVTTINTTINSIKNDISAINTILTSNDTDLDTLQELVNALKSNVASINDIFTQLGKKVDKTTTVNGYPLSSNVTLGKSDVGLGNVLNVESYSKSESDSKYANKFTVSHNLELDDADDLHVVDEPKFIAVETNTLKVIESATLPSNAIVASRTNGDEDDGGHILFNKPDGSYTAIGAYGGFRTYWFINDSNGKPQYRAFTVSKEGKATIQADEGTGEMMYFPTSGWNVGTSGSISIPSQGIYLFNWNNAYGFIMHIAPNAGSASTTVYDSGNARFVFIYYNGNAVHLMECAVGSTNASVMSETLYWKKLH